MTTGPTWGEDDDLQAAEYALGLLSTAESDAARRRAEADPVFRAAVAGWHENLAALADTLPQVTPPPDTRDAILRRLWPASPGPSGLWPLLERLRSVAFAALMAAVAAAVVLVAILPDADAPPVVAMRAELAAPDRSLVIEARLAGDVLTIERRVGAAPLGRAIELWVIVGDAAPVSLGVLPDAASVRLTLPKARLPALVAGAILAVSDEPLGGSPTGAPTGAVLATGTITQA